MVFFLLFFLFSISFFFLTPITISKVEKLRAGEINSIMEIEGLEAWPHGQFGNCFRLFSAKGEGEAVEDNYLYDRWSWCLPFTAKTPVCRFSPVFYHQSVNLRSKLNLSEDKV